VETEATELRRCQSLLHNWSKAKRHYRWTFAPRVIGSGCSGDRLGLRRVYDMPCQCSPPFWSSFAVPSSLLDSLGSSREGSPFPRGRRQLGGGNYLFSVDSNWLVRIHRTGAHFEP